MLQKLIFENYNIVVRNIQLIDSHFGTEIFLVKADQGDFIVKTLPFGAGDLENEGKITDYLAQNEVQVARILKTNNGAYHVKTDRMQFHMQEFIEGEILRVNTAPDWFLESCGRTLEKIHRVLRNYETLPGNFGKDFFTKANADGAKRYYLRKSDEAKAREDAALSADLDERLRQLERISQFEINTDKLTYANSHGDFHIGQIIVKDQILKVIDWTSASRVPAALEVMVSYVTADPACKDGEINANRLKRYIDCYSEFFSLSDYDLLMMPYLYYFQQLMCHYPPPYDDVPETYQPICGLINKTTKWLYENTERLSEELRR